jgi:pimeloyl-ACP methyl ester carboxylesterase
MFRVLFTVLLCTTSALCSWPNYLLYTQSTTDLPTTITASTCQKALDLTTNFTFIIHGFAASGYDDWIIDIKNLLLSTQNINVIAVDWQEGAKGPNYIAAKDNAIKTGKRLNAFIKECKIPPKKIYCIGHSLGAHACGFAGKGLTFARITGLDPAGPLFRLAKESDRLARTDAEYVFLLLKSLYFLLIFILSFISFVDILNSDACLGLHKSIGHKFVDFLQNIS